jgi:hypothetical protein
MPDTVEKTIYKLEIDDAGYIKGVESMAASTKKLVDEQNKANKTLQTNEAALKANGEFLQKAKKDLDEYTGTNERYRKQLEKSVKDAQADQVKLTALVSENRKKYDEATAAAQRFVAVAARATELQQQTTGGKIPTGPPPGIQTPIPDFNLKAAIPQTKEEFDQLALAIANAELHLETLNEESEEFKALKPVVDQAKVALGQYNEIVDDTGKKTVSLRTQIRLNKEELVKLEEAGKGATKEYIELEKQTAKLTDQYADQQQRIRILASDTKLLDFGKGAITAATSAFQGYTAVSILAGGQSEALQKKTMELFAAMQLLQSLEQLSNLTRREGVLGTLAASGAQTAYTAVVGASTGALKAFRLALATSGILAAVGAIGFLVVKYREMTDAAAEASREQKLIGEVNEKAVEGYSKEVAKLDILKIKLNDLTISQSKRLAAAKEYNKTAEESNKLDLKQIDNIDLVNKAIDRQIEKLKERAIARAAEVVIAEKAEAFFKAQVNLETNFPEFSDKAISDLENNAKRIIDARRSVVGIDEKTKIDTKELLSFADVPISEINRLSENQDKFKILLDDQTRSKLAFIAGQKKLIEEARAGERVSAPGLVTAQKDIIDAKEDFDKALQAVGGLIDINDLFDIKTGGNKTKVENVFVRTLRELLTRLRAASKTEFQSVDIIQQEFTDKLFDEIDKIDELVAKKQLTAKQGNFLTKILEKILGKESDKAVKDFSKKLKDAIDKINNELFDIQNKASLDSLNLLQDEFDRRAKLIDLNEKKEIEDNRRATQDRLDALELDKLLIGEKAYQDAKAVIIQTGEQNALNITAKFAQERQDLAADSFRKTLDAFGQGLNTGLVLRDEELAKRIRATSDKFLAGKISYEKFEKDITKIQKEEEALRRDITLANQRAELAALDRQIAAIKDKRSKEYKDLIKLRQDLSATISANEKEDAIKDAEADPNSRKLNTLSAYVDATAKLADSVVQFWQKANEAESKSLDQSISLQEKRVDAAQKIAARGNAEYLKQEEDRLTELNVKREAAARKQLGIDAALQASQVLVGITGAISKIASSPFGAETIAEIAIIVGALATGFGIVKSLQGNQPKLAKGDPYVKRNGAPSGVDTIPAWLNEGEAVTSAEKNKQYHPTIRAIHDGSIPAEHLNNFVKTYHKIKQVPQPNYERIKDATDMHITSDGRLAIAISEQNRLIMENTDVQRSVLRQIKNMGVNVSLDKNGFAVTQMEVIDQMKKDKKI